jgi:hypothetical protein
MLAFIARFQMTDTEQQNNNNNNRKKVVVGRGRSCDKAKGAGQGNK